MTGRTLQEAAQRLLRSHTVEIPTTWCGKCGGSWPCETAQVAQAVVGEAGEREAARDREYGREISRLTVLVADRDCELQSLRGASEREAALREALDDASRTVFALMRLFPKDDPVAVELWKAVVAMRTMLEPGIAARPPGATAQGAADA